MRLSKCPRCELNYVRPGQTLCDVCMRELGKVPVEEEPVEICPSCNEHPVVPGEELCKFCLRERQRLESAELSADAAEEEEDETAAPIEASTIEEVDPDALEGLDLDADDEEIPETELDEIDTELGLDEEEEEDDEDLLD